MKRNDHILRSTSQTIVVRPHVRIQQHLVVHPARFHTPNHRLGAKVGEQRVVDLDAPTAGGVQVFELGSVSRGDVCKVFVFFLKKMG